MVITLQKKNVKKSEKANYWFKFKVCLPPATTLLEGSSVCEMFNNESKEIVYKLLSEYFYCKPYFFIHILWILTQILQTEWGKLNNWKIKKIFIYILQRDLLGLEKSAWTRIKSTLRPKNMIRVLDQTLSTTVTKIIAELRGFIKTLNLEACKTIIGSWNYISNSVVLFWKSAWKGVLSLPLSL